MSWSTSDRRSRLPKDWHRRRAIAKRNAGGQCQWIEQGSRCIALGTDCDHIDRMGNDEPANLQWLCRAHHKAKTQREAQAAAALGRLPTSRPIPKHPGLI